MREPMRRFSATSHQLLAFLGFVFFYAPPPAQACIGGGSGGGVCCPAASSGCAPSVPVCPSYGYSSYSAGGSYAAPQASYPRPFASYSSPCSSGGCGGVGQSPCGSSSAGGCGGGPQISVVAPAASSYASGPVAGYAQSVQSIGPAYSAPLPPPPPPLSPSSSSYGGQVPQPAPGPELDSNYEDQHVAPSGPNYGDQPPPPVPPPPPPPYNENMAPSSLTDYGGNEGKQNYDNVTPSEASTVQAKSVFENQHDYADETNTIGGAEPASIVSASTPTGNNLGADDTTALNCEDADLRKIVEKALQQSSDNLDAARKIESEAATRFGGRFNSIVSNSEFAYVNWYGKRNCQLRVNDRHSLTWED